MKRGQKGLSYGGKAHIIDAMTILDSIWSCDGKYAKSDAIKRCWRKADILPQSWNSEINNEVGNNSIPMKDKTISISECNLLCNLLNKIKIKCKETNMNEAEAYGLEDSIFTEMDYSKKDMESMVSNWVDIEDDPLMETVIIDDEIEKDMETQDDELLNICDDEPVVETMPASEETENTTFLQC